LIVLLAENRSHVQGSLHVIAFRKTPEKACFFLFSCSKIAFVEIKATFVAQTLLI